MMTGWTKADFEDCRDSSKALSEQEPMMLMLLLIQMHPSCSNLLLWASGPFFPIRDARVGETRPSFQKIQEIVEITVTQRSR